MRSSILTFVEQDHKIFESQRRFEGSVTKCGMIPSQSNASESGYALVAVLFLVVILSLLSTIIIKSDLFLRDQADAAVYQMQSAYAASSGIVLATAAVSSDPGLDSSFVARFADGSNAKITVVHWGLFEYAMSQGVSHFAKSTRSALLADRLGDADAPALDLGNVSHGLVLAGKTRIVGDVEVGRQGVSTGSLGSSSEPRDVPVDGKIMKVASPHQFLDTLIIDRETAAAKSIFLAAKRNVVPHFPGAVLDTSGYVNLSGLSDSIREIFGAGYLTLSGSITKRGPPLRIIATQGLNLLPGCSIIGPVAIYSADSVSIPSGVNLVNAVIFSPASISLLRGATLTAQLFSPVIRCEPNSVANYPSLFVSVSLSDTSGVGQLVDIATDAKVSGAIVMRAGRGISLREALIDIEPGSVITGEVYTDAYLTMDGTVEGLIRTFDLYFYDSPTTYIGWLRNGIIDRGSLPRGFLKPLGTQGGNGAGVLAWM